MNFRMENEGKDMGKDKEFVSLMKIPHPRYV